MLDQSDPQRIAQRELQTLAKEAQFLSGLPPQEMLNLLSAGEHRWFPEGTILVAEGSEIEEVHLILRGLASVGFYESVNPGLWLYVCGPKSLVDPCALLDPPISPVTIRALTEIETVVIPREVFAGLMLREPSVGYEVMRALASRMALINGVALKELCQEYPGPSRN